MRNVRLFAAVAAAFPSAAVNRYTVQPKSPKPEVCQSHGTIPAGTWLQNSSDDNTGHAKDCPG